MQDEIRAELQRLHGYAEASEQDFATVAAEAVVVYRRSLAQTRQALADITDAKHFQVYPLAPRPE